MQEFSSVSASSYDAASLTAKLNEKSAEGWSVVAIVPTGGDVTAFLSREASDTPAPVVEAPAEPQPEPEHAPVVEAAPVVAAAAVTEPAGWGVAPDPSPAVATGAEPAPAAGAGQVSGNPPADWYADPAHRFDLRYWDGGKWTEHVSRGGQQFTDPPVA